MLSTGCWNRKNEGGESWQIIKTYYSDTSEVNKKSCGKSSEDPKL
jgi:hypothetical protein